ncbi:DNA repair protein REV1-like isoform X2 [Sycon ciliatum]|uniref:DNA repair protein REV1-like isoform X2 n=1 Tax=Sycon ciliatum TaxID=27933 RepID=UPI0031F673A9
MDGRSSDAVQSDMFAGVIIHVNGYTDPSSDELKRLIHMHGGGYQHYYRKTRVTHVIATNLTDTKIKALKGELIVLPDWITESIDAGKRLDVKPYLLYDQPITQRTISFPQAVSPRQQLSTGSKIRASTVTDSDSVGACETITSEKLNDLASSSALTEEDIDLDSLEETGASGGGDGAADDLPMDDGWDEDASDGEAQDIGNSDGYLLSNQPDHSSGEAASQDKSQQTCPKLSDGMGHEQLAKTSTHPALKAGERGFVAEFYGHSRLHHLSTWGAELRKFTSMLSNKPASRGLEWRKQHPATGSRSRQRTVMHVDMDCFFVAISLRNFPQHVGKPVAVTHGSIPKGSASNAVDSQQSSAGGSAGELEHPAVIATIGESSLASNSTTADLCDRQPIASTSTSTAAHVPSSTSASRRVSAPAAARDGGAFSMPGPGSSADIASCSYEARARGVKNGMWLTRAVELCPDLVTVPYDFAAYRVASQSLYQVLTSFSRTIEAVSCDEAFIDVSSLVHTDEEAKLLAEDIRKAILDATGVMASAGIASNVLLARMATRLGKPNGQYLVTEPEVLEFIGKQDVGKLPGVGHATTRQLASMGVETCLDLRKLSLSVLKEQFGPKTGLLLWDHARGKDDRELRVTRERKSISAEINYGMRFKQKSDVEKFVMELSNELEQRMASCQMKGQHLCLKMKVRKPTAPKESRKHMGHGLCDNLTKSMSLPSAVSDSAAIRRFVWTLIEQLKVDYCDIRGMGIQMQKLVSTEKVAKSATAPIRAFFSSTTSKTLQTAASASSVRLPMASHVAAATTRVSPESIRSKSLRQTPSSVPAHAAAAATATAVTPTAAATSTLTGEFADSTEERVGHTPISSAGRHVPEAAMPFVVTPTQPPLPFLPTQSAYRSGCLPRAAHSKSSAASFADKISAVVPRNSSASSTSVVEIKDDSDLALSAASGSTATGQSDLALPAHEDLDESVLAALPDSIRRDIELAYKQQRGSASNATAASVQAEKLSHSDLFPTTSQLDRNVLAALPPALRAEVMYDQRNYRRQQASTRDQHHHQQQPQLPKSRVQQKPKSIPQQPAVDPKQTTIPTAPSTRSKYHIESTAERQMHLFAEPVSTESCSTSKTYTLVAELKGECELPKVKRILKEWVHSTNEPEAADGLVLARYLAKLMVKYNLQQAWLLLQALQRLVEDLPAWYLVFNAILSHCQAQAELKWNSRLPMKPFGGHVK